MSFTSLRWASLANLQVKIKYSLVKKKTLLPLKSPTEDNKRRKMKSLKIPKLSLDRIYPMTMLQKSKMKTWSSCLYNLLRRPPRSKKTMSKWSARPARSMSTNHQVRWLRPKSEHSQDSYSNMMTRSTLRWERRCKLLTMSTLVLWTQLKSLDKWSSSIMMPSAPTVKQSQGTWSKLAISRHRNTKVNTNA